MNILILNDFTAASAKALDYILEIVQGTKQHILVTDIRSDLTPTGKVHTGGADKFLEHSKTGSDLNYKEVSGKTLNGIIKANNIDLLVIGIHPEEWISDLLSAENSDLINKISCPILSVPFHANIGVIDKIGYASDLREVDSEVAALIPFVKLFGAQLEVFHVYPIFPEEVNVNEFDADAVLAKLIKANDYKMITLHYVKTAGENEVVEGVNEYIKIYKPDLIAMFTASRNWLDQLLDASKTEELSKTLSIPVLSFPLNK